MNICVLREREDQTRAKAYEVLKCLSLSFLPLLFRSMPETTGRCLLYPAGLSVSPEACRPGALPAGFPDSRGHLHFSR